MYYMISVYLLVSMQEHTEVILEVFNNTSGSAANAQDAFNIVYNALKEAGVPLDELNKKTGTGVSFRSSGDKKQC